MLILCYNKIANTATSQLPINFGVVVSKNAENRK